MSRWSGDIPDRLVSRSYQRTDFHLDVTWSQRLIFGIASSTLAELSHRTQCRTTMLPLHFLLIAVVAAVGLILNWRLEIFFHNRRLHSKRLRIHVNGIRGKSTVTRIVAGMLRHADLNTVAKTTGSAACVIDHQGNDQSIRRTGAPTILEQIDIIKQLDPQVDALVIECMAIKPEYQRICEEKLVRSNIGIITNVREDHQEVLGENLEQIARSLLSTCPRNGVLVTAEQNLSLLNLFKNVCARRNTRLVIADPNGVLDDELSQFPYVAFKDNVAIGLALAKELNIDRHFALAGMALAKPDPGALTIKRLSISRRQLDLGRFVCCE